MGKRDSDSLPGPDQLAQRIRKITAESGSYSEFGRSFIRNALTEAAATLESGKQKTDSVELNVRVNVRFVLPRPPGPPDVPKTPGIDPENFDLCYEICAAGEQRRGFWACYSECKAGVVLDGDELLLQRCQRLWEEFRQGNRLAFFELLQAGCIDFREMVVALEPLMTRAR